MSDVINQNQFSIINIKGKTDLLYYNTIACEIASTETKKLLPGQAVSLVNISGIMPKIKATVNDTDAIFGFINYTMKDRYFVKNQRCEVSLFGNVMIMEAAGPISRGADVAAVIPGIKVTGDVGGKTIIGICLGKATAEGDLVRVYIKTPSVSASASDMCGEAIRQLGCKEVNANYEMQPNDYMIYVDGSTNPVDIIAPDPMANVGKEYCIKAKDVTNLVRIVPYLDENFDGEPEILFPTDKKSIIIKSFDGNWLIK